MKKASLFILMTALSLSFNYVQAQEAGTKKTKTTEATEFVVNETILKTYVGTYKVDFEVDVVITLEGGQLYGEPTQQRKLRLVPKSNTRFALEEIGAELEFNTNEKGLVDSFTFIRGGEKIKALRMPSK